MKQEHLDFLKELGLTITESKVYLTLLESGESLAGTIAARANIYRKNVYDALEVLSRKGLVSSKFKEKKRYWIAMPPSRIQSLLKEKLGFFNTILPELTERYNENKPKQTIEVYEGLEGIKSLHNLILQVNKDFYLVGATGKIFKRFKYAIPTYLEEASQTNMQAYQLFSQDYDAAGLKRFKQTKRTHNRLLPKEFITPTQLFLFWDYSAIVIQSEEPLAIVIKSREIRAGFQQYFDFLWRISKPL